MKRLNACGRQKMLSEIKVYLDTATEQPPYLAALTVSARNHRNSSSRLVFKEV